MRDTIACVNSINNLRVSCDDVIDIIIVDNSSPNGSGIELKNKYNGQDNIHVLILENNIGFANGNNYGYKYAKKVCHADFIIVSNNDVVFPQIDFLRRLERVYTATQFEVCGPDIVVPSSGLHQNPVSLRPYNRNDVVSTIALYEKKLSREERGGLLIFVKEAVKMILESTAIGNRFIKLRNKFSHKEWMKSCYDNPILHGACVICSSSFISREQTIFWPGTFMYFEEPILNYLCNIKRYRMIYSNELTVFHNEDSSTNFTYSSRLERNRFKYTNGIKSGYAFLDLIDAN